MEISFALAYVNPENPNRFVRRGNAPTLIIYVKNIGHVIVNNINLILKIEPYLIFEEFRNSIGEEIVINGVHFLYIVRENVVNEITSIDGKIIGRQSGRYTPLLPQREHSFALPLTSNFDEIFLDFSFAKPTIIYQAYADNMPYIEGEIPF